MTRTEQFIEFVTNYWQLWILFTILLLLLIITEIRNRFFGLPKLTPQELVNAINQHEAVVLDIRPGKEYHSGHILHAEHIPLTELNQKAEQLKKYQDKLVVVVCSYGQQASQAGKMLQKHGITNVKMLAGGMNAWQNANLPLAKK